jgi:catechol 2,3-dioxygenase-like lactoylglutathione lyase family enzyme
MSDSNSPVAVNGIHHYTASVADIGRSAKWYAEILGFKAKGKASSGDGMKLARLCNGTIELELVQVSKPNPLPSYRSLPDTDNAVRGHKHFSFRVADGPWTEKQLRALGAKVVFVPVVGETYGIFICDPTGNLIEILQETRPDPSEQPTPITGKQPIPIQGWSHIAVSVPDTDSAIDWYSSMLGFSVAHSDSITSPGGHSFKITWLQGPGFSLELFEVPGSSRIPEERLNPGTDLKTLGNKYLCLSVDDPAKTRADFLERGVGILPSPILGSTGLFIRDNSGNLIEFCAPQ